MVREFCHCHHNIHLPPPSPPSQPSSPLPQTQQKKDIYYENFSKFLLNTEYANSTKYVPSIYSFLQWKTNPSIIERTQLKVLKHTLKTHRLPIYGNKQVLIARLTQYYTQILSAEKIQKVFRGFLVRESEKQRGPAANNRAICTNDTEFETMNPLDDIPRKYFFSYKNDSGFVYGFNIMSLMSLFKHNRKLINPYNREDIPFDVLQSIFSLYKRIRIIYHRR
jgi:hypothetical protein